MYQHHSYKQHCSSIFQCCFNSLIYYETTRCIRVEIKWIGVMSLIVKFSLALGCIYLMFQRDSYQIFDRSPISSVTVKVKQSSTCSNKFPYKNTFVYYNCANSLNDVHDFVSPAIENSVVSITTRTVEYEHKLVDCDTELFENKNNHSLYLLSSNYQCSHWPNCILPPYYRSKYQTNSSFTNFNLCWFKSPLINTKLNYQAFDYVLFIKHHAEFTHLNLVRHNLLSDILMKNYTSKCEYDPKSDPLCPKFRVSKILEIIENDRREFASMFYYGALIEIKINWKCNLDRPLKSCEPIYEFKRLDLKPYDQHPYYPGSNFLTSRYFYKPNSRELYRLHTRIYKLRIMISVTGDIGRFDLVQTTTSIGSYLGIFGTGSIVCDLFAGFIMNLKRLKYDY